MISARIALYGRIKSYFAHFSTYIFQVVVMRHKRKIVEEPAIDSFPTRFCVVCCIIKAAGKKMF